MILQIHAYLALIILAFIAYMLVGIFRKYQAKQAYQDTDLRKALFVLILVYMQMLVGLAHYFMSPAYHHLKEIGFGVAMKDSQTRLLTVEHPLMMLLAILFISLGFVKHRKKTQAMKKYKSLLIYYTLALLFMLSRIPWHQWLFA